MNLFDDWLLASGGRGLSLLRIVGLYMMVLLLLFEALGSLSGSVRLDLASHKTFVLFRVLLDEVEHR